MPTKILALTLATLAGPQAPAHADWAQKALVSEADYLVDCSFTERARNHAEVQVSDEAYGAFNNVRLAGGPDWVRPGEGAMAIIGLMAASAQLKQSGQDILKYNAVIDAWFNNWLVGKGQAYCGEAQNPAFGGFAARVMYNKDGSLSAKPAEFNTGVTGAVICAMWKYVEYNRRIGRKDVADKWLRGPAYELALLGGKFLNRCRNTKFNLLSPSPAGGNLWTSDAALGVAGLRCLARWGLTVGKQPVLDDSGMTPGKLAGALCLGLEAMKDTGATKGFFKYLNPADGSRGYGDNLDQLCFVPYETNALNPGQDFNKSISDFWTNGANGRRMTWQTNDPKAWTYFGTRWHSHDQPNVEDDRLTPGAGLQLAKVEWKFGSARKDAALRDRAAKRLEFVASTARSNLWFGADGRQEAGVAGGIVDWRLASETDPRAETGRADGWQRFIDTSAYFIEVVLMTRWNRDTTYTPE